MISTIQARFRAHLTYSNVAATLALFLALGGSSYAVLRIDSRQIADNAVRSVDVRNNELRSKDVRDRTLRARDVGRNALVGSVIRERTLATVPHSSRADQVGGFTAQELRLRCPSDTTAKTGVCIETSPRAAADFLLASNLCDQGGRGLPTMAQLDRMARSNGPLSPQGEWTSNVYRIIRGTSEQLEAVVIAGFGDSGAATVSPPEQRAFRCVALPSN